MKTVLLVRIVGRLCRQCSGRDGRPRQFHAEHHRRERRPDHRESVLLRLPPGRPVHEDPRPHGPGHGGRGQQRSGGVLPSQGQPGGLRRGLLLLLRQLHRNARVVWNNDDPRITGWEDMDYTTEVINRVKQSDNCNDAFICGLSKGGHMAYAYACERPATLKAACSVDEFMGLTSNIPSGAAADHRVPGHRGQECALHHGRRIRWTPGARSTACWMRRPSRPMSPRRVSRATSPRRRGAAGSAAPRSHSSRSSAAAMNTPSRAVPPATTAPTACGPSSASSSPARRRPRRSSRSRVNNMQLSRSAGELLGRGHRQPAARLSVAKERRGYSGGDLELVHDAGHDPRR